MTRPSRREPTTRFNLVMSPKTTELLKKLQEHLDADSQSEVFRRAIQEMAQRELTADIDTTAPQPV